MTDNYLLVPMHLDIMVLNERALVETPFLRFRMDYSQLESFNPPEPPPFAGAVPPSAGTYLHWTLPRALRHGTHNKDGSADFLLVPNRWLIARIRGGARPEQAVKAWILESDFLDERHGTSPFVVPGNSDSNETPKQTKIGRALRLTPDLKNLAIQSDPFLKAIGPGSLVFATFSPGVENVFSFYDDLTDNDDKTQISEGTFTYFVAGWYSDPKHDPLSDTKWAANPDPSLKGSYSNDQFDWIVYADHADLPKQMIVHALVSSVPWTHNAANLPAQDFPTQIRDSVKVALGNTAIDALAAIVRLNRNSQTEADLLEAFQYGLLEKFDEPGSSEALNMAIRQHWYGASSGGTLWAITPKEQTGPDRAPEATELQRTVLAGLNAEQCELDRQQRILESMQWNLFSLWWKYNWQQYNNPPVDADVAQWLSTQLKLQISEGTTPNIPGGADPSKEQWYFCKVKAQQNLVAKLTQQTANAKERLNNLLDKRTQELKALNQPQYYYPNDPVLLITNLGRSTNFDPVDGLICRLQSQTINTLTVNGVTYRADDSCGQDMRSQMPILEDQNNILPDAIRQIHIESFFLRPTLFAQALSGRASQADQVRQAIRALPKPAANARFAPVSYAMEEWSQPWVPLLLDWEITVLREPAYREEKGQPTCAFNQKHWFFNGTDYQWNGPTNSSGADFNENSSRQMTLQGRTFITPQISFTLADQLRDYIQKHKMRDPGLETLAEDLERYIEGLKNQDVLSQRLSGMMARMVERDYTQNVTPAGSLAKVLGDYRHGCPRPFPDEHSSCAEAVWSFVPLCGTFFVINKLTVIDSFGRTIDLMLADHSANPLTADSRAEEYFYPIAGRNLKAPTAKDPAPGVGKSANATERMIQLTPRLVQDSQLAFRLVSSDGKNDDIHQVAGANPVCGWMAPNHLDRSLALYAPDGAAWGELYLSKCAADKYVAVWQPDPTNRDAPQTIEQIPNSYVRAMLQTLYNRDDNGQGFRDVIKAIDEALWTVNPRGQRKDQNLTALIGRPLAIVRASLSLRLRGLPCYSQDWWNTFDVDPNNLDSSSSVPLATVDGGISDYLWPVRLGSLAFHNDGVIGYFRDDPMAPADTFQVFNASHLPSDAGSDYLKEIGQNNYLQIRFIDDSCVSPDPAKNQVCHITLLADPRGSMHAFTGLLPVVSMEIPNQFVAPALQQMFYVFRAGPFLTSPDEVRIPQPAERKGVWSWFDNTLNTTVALAQADDKARFATTSPLIKEGWLKFTPNPSDKDE